MVEIGKPGDHFCPPVGELLFDGRCEVGQLFMQPLLGGHEINGPLVFDEFLNQPCLAYPPTAIDYRKFKSLPLISLFQSGKFFLSSNKHGDHLPYDI